VLQRGQQYWSDDAILEGIGAPSRLRLKFGLLLLDIDLDGRVELVQANGHLEDEIHQVQRSQQYRQPAQLFWHRGAHERGCYVEAPAALIGALAQPVVGRALSCADIDGDGDLDLCITQVAGPPLLLRNDQRLGHNWLRLRLVGRPGNTDAIGARVEVMAGGSRQQRWVSPTRSYLTQTELPVTFGLGAATSVDNLVITWPDGAVTRVADVPLNKLTTLRQPTRE
jgi:hypothetical protein